MVKQGWENLKVGFIGGGNMAKAIGFAIINKGLLNANQIMVSAPSDSNLDEWKTKGASTTHTNGEVVSQSDYIFIAVKPQYFVKAIREAVPFIMIQNQEISSALSSKIFVSIMAGVRISYIKNILNNGLLIPDQPSDFEEEKFKIVRVMPNTPLLVGKGFSAICCEREHYHSNPKVQVVADLMRSGGECDFVLETQMDAIGAISGSGPAYMYLVIEALSDGGVKCGLPRALATKLAAATMAGAAEMVLKGTEHPGQLKDAVCSPGGTTITAIHTLEKNGVRSAFMDAVEAAFKRSKEL